jgi:leucyl aminopeptidase
MEFISLSKDENRKPAELVAIPFWQGEKQAENAVPISRYKAAIQLPAIQHDFQGKEGELLFVYGKNPKEDKRYALLGLGKKENISVERLRRAYSQLTRACQQKKIEDVFVLLPQTPLTEKEVVVGISEGILLTNYVFDKLKHAKKADKPSLLKKVGFISVSKLGFETAKHCQIIAEGVYIARDLVNGNADDVTPQYLSKFAQSLARKLPHVKSTILDKRQLEKEKMGLLLAVNQGSVSDPALIILKYSGNPSSKDHTVLIGKGITYDTGGLNLKPMASMETMKSDMAGAAAILGTFYAAASLNLKTNLSVVIPATENSIGPKSFKIGDVYKSYQGRTVEITNPDAEGRLVLADAITYAKKKLKPTRIIDVATLTGGIDIALGPEACGLFSNDDDLAISLHQAGNNTYERVWRLPVYEEYRDSLKSEIADMKNSASRTASSIIAAIFLQEFVEETPWAHLDIASVAYFNDRRRYHPKLGTGFGVRLLLNWLG